LHEVTGSPSWIRTVMNASENWQRMAGESRADFLAALAGQTQGSVNEGVNQGEGSPKGDPRHRN
jgi:hypothetical protein